MNYPFSFHWTQAHEDFCLSEKIFLQHSLRIKNVYRKRNFFLFRKGKKFTLSCDVFVENFSTMPYGGFFSMGIHSYSSSNLPNDVQVGRYCSIASNVSVMGTQHPINRFTTSPLVYDENFSKESLKYFEHYYDITPYIDRTPMPKIGNDVWIGDGVTLKRGISIGDGAIIGAHAVVTKDVPPYAIVVGVPAKIIKFRFEDNVIEKLNKLRWWDYPFIKLPTSKESENIDFFMDALERKIKFNDIEEQNFKKINLSKVFHELSL
ncbi:CatB-related O-acetyltransferase [Pectobacterium parmentieri]|nr:CatB-related O-acetyltransferase [Pectobacterium parmentieri]